ncbi:hypothetical protein [Nocardiopsis composta]|uniref:Uncharacterized protein n=1 Tax=Nocardiopsis composta TaxID=157465 RepID=A0A7W8QTB9_9ACTN|nr:hypothetical protein [Nocardiopsis composta]MBB5435216.1 hypothetical protein [Nocardiopsis composta]
MPAFNEDALDRFITQASYARITPHMVRQVLAQGPGTVIAYDLASAKYRVMGPGRVTEESEEQAVTVWGHGDIADELPRQRDMGVTMTQFAEALSETAFGYLLEWHEEGQALHWVEQARQALATNGFHLDRRSDRLAPGVIRDHFVALPEPELRLAVKYRHTSRARRFQVQMRLWDLGRQVSGAVFATTRVATGRAVTYHLRQAMARRARRFRPQF